MPKKSTKPNGQLSPITIKKYADGYTGPAATDDRNLYIAFGKLHQAKSLEDQAATLRQEAHDVLVPYHLTTGATAMVLPNVGAVDVFQGSQKRTDYTKAKELLVTQYGVPADHVSAAWDEATKKVDNKKPTVKFKAGKGK